MKKDLFTNEVIIITEKENALVRDIVDAQTGIEKAIASHAAFIRGALSGKPRSGHPEGAVIYHIKAVLENVEKYYVNDPDYSKLRIIAMLHDTFKYKVDQTKPKVGENHHGMIARHFAEKYINDTIICKIIELHDEAYNAWQVGGRRGNWYKAQQRAMTLINTLKDLNALELYLKFYRCDNETGDKSNDNYEWFKAIVDSTYELTNNN